MRVIPVPCLRDNYAYLVVNESTGRAAVVDPSEVEPVLLACQRENIELDEIWLTHHHWDHVGGIEGIVAACPIEQVRGSSYDAEHGRIPNQNVSLSDGDSFDFGTATVEVLEIPGHTLGAIAFLAEGQLFSGDTLFLAGCGRVFEGTMQMMSESLLKLRALPAETSIWCGHEYTLNNLRFAKTVEPQNAEVSQALAQAEARRAAGKPTIPGRIGTERETNPFLRFDREPVIAGRDPVAAFTAIRSAKDEF